MRKTFEVPGPANPDALPLDQRARQVFQYFKKYNYDVAQDGEVIKFTGIYQASRGQAAALIFYVFCGEPEVPVSTNATHSLCGCRPKRSFYF